MPELIKRSLEAVASDVAEGFVTVNPLFLKRMDKDSIRSLFEALKKKQNEIRAEPFPFNDTISIRKRNMRLQRLFNSVMIIKNFAREKPSPFKQNY
ncbi:MAG: hypothetical protein LLF86_03050 [Nitrospiraceae bacterium]|nr:hypothetical protein [Nitrospiraceae bacterium]